MNDFIDLTNDDPEPVQVAANNSASDSIVFEPARPAVSAPPAPQPIVQRRSIKRERQEAQYRALVQSLNSDEAHRLQKCYQALQDEKADIMVRRRALQRTAEKPVLSATSAREKAMLDAALLTFGQWVDLVRDGKVRGVDIEKMRSNGVRLANGLRSRIESLRSEEALSKLHAETNERFQQSISTDRSYLDARANSLVTPVSTTTKSKYQPDINPPNSNAEIFKRALSDAFNPGLLPDGTRLPTLARSTNGTVQDRHPLSAHTFNDLFDSDDGDDYGNYGGDDTNLINEAYEHMVDLAMQDAKPLDMPPQMHVHELEHQKQGLGWLVRAEKGSNKGGILADDMGLGKTVQTIALMYANRPDSLTTPDKKLVLIVCPVALIETWSQELKNRVKPPYRLRVYVHHRGTTGRLIVRSKELSNYDVVICTYQALVFEYKALELSNQHKTHGPHPLYDVHWHRVVLDEAHKIKNRMSKASIACAALKSEYRLALTGTPMQNKVCELFSLIRFLRIEPYWRDYTRFKHDLPVEKMDRRNLDTRGRKLATLLSAIMLRRCKDTVINGKKIIDNLPKKTVYDVYLSMEGKEKKDYDFHQKRVSEGVLDDPEMGYSHILSLILMLRMRANHPKLPKISRTLREKTKVLGRNKESREKIKQAIAFSKNLPSSLFEDTDRVCAFCSSNCAVTADTYVTNKCLHYACVQCETQQTENINEGLERVVCPQCNSTVAKFYSLELLEIIIEMPPESTPEDVLEAVIEAQTPRAELERQETLEREEQLKALQTTTIEEEDLLSDNSDWDLDFLDDPSISQSSDASQPRRTNILKLMKDSTTKYKIDDQEVLKGDPLYKRIDIDEIARLFPARNIFQAWESSVKVDGCMQLLNFILRVSPAEKVIVFTSFTSLIHVLTIPLDAAQVPYLMYTGAMTIDDRNDALRSFKTGRSRILLTSLHAGNVGLTLTEANHVILMEPFWNPYVEEQAQDRVYRIGQSRDVSIYRMRVQDTIEDRIVELQEKKRSIIESALDPNIKISNRQLSRSDLLYALGAVRRPRPPPPRPPANPAIRF